MALSRVLHTPGRLRDSANDRENSKAIDRKSSDSDSVMIKLVFCHSILDSITSTSTVSLSTSTERLQSRWKVANERVVQSRD
jgi:hypothetical protein